MVAGPSLDKIDVQYKRKGHYPGRHLIYNINMRREDAAFQLPSSTTEFFMHTSLTDDQLNVKENVKKTQV